MNFKKIVFLIIGGVSSLGSLYYLTRVIPAIATLLTGKLSEIEEGRLLILLAVGCTIVIVLGLIGFFTIKHSLKIKSNMISDGNGANVSK